MNVEYSHTPLQNGTFLSIENGTAWNPTATAGQFLRQVDLAGNVIRETNTGVLQQELLALGSDLTRRRATLFPNHRRSARPVSAILTMMLSRLCPLR